MLCEVAGDYCNRIAAHVELRPLFDSEAVRSAIANDVCLSLRLWRDSLPGGLRSLTSEIYAMLLDSACGGTVSFLRENGGFLARSRGATKAP